MPWERALHVALYIYIVMLTGTLRLTEPTMVCKPARTSDGDERMPAIITHDTFGQDAYDRLHTAIGTTKDEVEAFLLGNQGPDPMFYSIVDPMLTSVHHLGNDMHDRLPSELLFEFHRAADELHEADRPIGRAYAMGFLGHYMLDSSMHPLVYYWEHAICDAGVPGLTRADSGEVHAVIEREYDELVLTANRGETVETYNPSIEILRGSHRMLGIVSRMYTEVALRVYGLEIPINAFEESVLCFRMVQHLYYSPSGAKIEVLGSLEQLFRHYSIYRAMSHRAVLREYSDFDNHEHSEWQNPFTGETSIESFWTIYRGASERYDRALVLFCSDGFGIEEARAITGSINFGGEPVNE